MAAGHLHLILWSTVLIAAALAQESGGAQHDEPSIAAASKKAPARRGNPSMYSGISVQRYVSNTDLPEGDTAWVFLVHYRVVGPDMQYGQLDSSKLRKVITAVWEKFYAIPRLELKVDIKPAPLAPGSAEESCALREDQGQCFLRSFSMAESYHALDLQVTTGVTRQTQFPDIGEKEWTYTRILDAMLRDAGFDVRVTIQHLDIFPEGVGVLKHIPFAPLYAEELMVQLSGMDLLPLNLAKQNLLYAALDCIGLNTAVGMGWLQISHVSEAWYWEPQRGDVGQANITLRTMRDKPGAAIGEALARVLPRLLERMDEEGLPRVTATVLWSRPLHGHSPQDQIAAVTGSGEGVRAYDLRDPLVTIPEYPHRPQGRSLLLALGILALLGTATAIAGGHVYMSRRRARQDCGLPHSPFEGVPAATIFGHRFSFKQEGTVGPKATRAATQGEPLGRISGGTSSNSGSHNPFSKQGGHSGRLMSFRDQNIKALGDSATETAGLEGVSEARKKAQIKSELERASSLKGWEIHPSAISVCKREDGSDWLLGSGGYGQVYRGLRSGVQDVAIKVLSYSKELQMQQFWVEINLLKSLSFDRNVVQFYGVVLDEACPMLILELMEGGDLRNALSGPDRDRYQWYAHGQELAMDVVRGLAYLHENRVIHGDLKSKNVLLSRGGATAKLSDVGMSRVLATTLVSGDHTRTAPGTFAYAAPELLLGQRCTMKADIFSLGVTLWEIVTQAVPVRGQLRQIQAPEECPESISQLIDQCLLPTAEDRPTAREVFQVLRASETVPTADRSDSGSSAGKLRFRPSLGKLDNVSE